MKIQLKVLVVDDEEELRKSISSVLKSTLNSEFELVISEAADGQEALDLVGKKSFDVILMDVKMPKLDGLETLSRVKEVDPRVFVVIMTAHSNLQDAITAIKLGAYDYIEKPIESQKLINLIKKAIDTRKMVSDLAISNPIFDDDIDSQLIGHSGKMLEVFTLINKLAHVDTTVLIRGENGTGKELVARAIHYNSPRKHGPFVAINCAAIPENLIESELFGHEKGAFTGASERKIGKFQHANKGTLFLDEVAELTTDLQVKLLRVLQERNFTPVGSNREMKTNARIVAATNQNLEKMIEEGQLREDFFYRLNVMPIFLPSLRDRSEDIEGLVSQFISKFSKKHGRTITGITDDALELLKKYQWPGNIRELENSIERAFILESSPRISINSIPEKIITEASKKAQENLKTRSSGQHGNENLDFDQFKEQSEKEFIENALSANGGKINKTVAQANIPKNTLLRKIKKYNIDVQKFIK